MQISDLVNSTHARLTPQIQKGFGWRKGYKGRHAQERESKTKRDWMRATAVRRKMRREFSPQIIGDPRGRKKCGLKAWHRRWRRRPNHTAPQCGSGLVPFGWSDFGGWYLFWCHRRHHTSRKSAQTAVFQHHQQVTAGWRHRQFSEDQKRRALCSKKESNPVWR